MTQQTILIFIDWYEPGFKAGGPIQSCRNFVAAMKDDYRIRIITSDRDQGDLQPYDGINVNVWTESTDKVSVYYAGPGNLTPARLKSLVEEVAPDHIYLNSMFSFRYTILPLWLKWRGRIKSRVVIAPRGMLHKGALQFKPAKKKLFIQLLKGAGLPKMLVFQATDEQEVEDVRRWFPTVRDIRLVPNFVKRIKVEWKPAPKVPGQLQGVFVSRVAPKKNLLFFLNLLKELPESVRFHLDIYGEAEDQDYSRRCTSAIEALPAHVTAAWKGAVPNHAIIGILQQYHLFVLPTLGENFGHAIFEALLAGRPVLISDQTPWLNLASRKAGWDLPLDDATGFIRAIEETGGWDQSTFDEWGQAAWSYAQAFIDDPELRRRYISLFSNDGVK